MGWKIASEIKHTKNRANDAVHSTIQWFFFPLLSISLVRKRHRPGLVVGFFLLLILPSWVFYGFSTHLMAHSVTEKVELILELQKIRFALWFLPQTLVPVRFVVPQRLDGKLDSATNRFRQRLRQCQWKVH